MNRKTKSGTVLKLNMLLIYRQEICPSPKRMKSSGAQTASYSMGNGVSFPGVKLSGSDADHSHPSTPDVKNEWSYTSTPTI